MIGFVLIVPPAASALLYALCLTLLHATNRVIQPEILWYATAIELPVFFFFAVLEARSHW